ncbi:MAG: hypothetical protein GY862_32670 [Gammaproteobacteria bacterium]|nr:hypothetical protein [Gammaproteobacteria bacterium]
MPYTMEDYWRDSKPDLLELINLLSVKERLKGIPEEELLKRISACFISRLTLFLVKVAGRHANTKKSVNYFLADMKDAKNFSGRAVKRNSRGRTAKRNFSERTVKRDSSGRTAKKNFRGEN